MKILTIVGTRPEIIRLSRILPKLDGLCEHILVHTNQNFNNNLKDIFFSDLRLRQPRVTLYASMATESNRSFGLGTQLADMFPQIEELLKKEKPDKVFILGDTNSALCAIIAERMGIPVYHMEAANRSFNHEIPEEINRVLLDHICSYNLYYTPTNKHTLLKEGMDIQHIFQCGNPTLEVLEYYKQDIEKSDILDRLELNSGFYFLVDIHRNENINKQERLESLLGGLNMLAGEYDFPVICSVHPSTKDKMKNFKMSFDDRIKFIDSFGFFDFVKLEKNARVGLTDSGLCSEEYCLLRVPCVILRNETERPEVVEAGGAIISGTEADSVFVSVVNVDNVSNRQWCFPDGYGDFNVSDRVVNYLLSKNK